MSATYELRAELTRRGVEFQKCDTTEGCFTFWRVNGIDAGFDDMERWEQPHLLVVGFTPEQVIAATLGDTDATHERQGNAETCRPCPFCGSNAETVHTLNVVPHEPWWIRCPSCGVTTPKYSSETDAIAAWNRRADDAQ